MTAVPITFRVPSGLPLPARLLDARRHDDEIRVTIDVGQEEWQTIDLVMLFNLAWDKRNPGEVSGENVVRLELRLDPRLTEQWSGGDDVAGALTALDADDELLSTANWYALEATEAVALPPSLADTGELRQGFTTYWADHPEATAD